MHNLSVIENSHVRQQKWQRKQDSTEKDSFKWRDDEVEFLLKVICNYKALIGNQ